MTPNARRSFAFAAAAALLVAGGLSYQSFAETTAAESAAAKAEVGKPAPGFELKDQDGKLVRLDDYKDKVVVLEWFNDECPFVQKWYKTGEMNKVAKTYTEKGVVWLTINSSAHHNVDHNKTAAGKLNINRPLLDDSAGKVGHAYDAKTTPQMFVIDKGTLVYDGAIDSIRSTDTEDLAKGENYVKAALDEVLDGKPVTKAKTTSYGCSVKYK